MASATLKFDDREIAIGAGGATFGRGAENLVSLPDNSNISRNHAEIRVENGRFVIEDLGSSNGTTINGQPLEGVAELGDGDFITLGNSVIVEFILDEDDSVAASTATTGGAEPASDSPKGRFPVMLAVAGAAAGLAVVLVVVAATVVYSSRAASGCDATARIASPGNGETIFQETEVRINVTNSACVASVRVMLNGREIAKLDEEPYATKIDPRNYPELSDGRLYDLKLVIEDGQGNQTAQSRDVALQFETRELSTPKPTATATATATPLVASGKQPSLIDVQKMTAAVVGKFTGGSFKYNLANQEFLTEVRKRTPEYAAAGGFSARALPFKEAIDQAFVRERSLDPSIPYLLAMSRGRFTFDKDDTGEGLWRMTTEFAVANNYTAGCAAPTIGDPVQECATKAAAVYMEDLVVKTFDGDIVFAVAAFGGTAQEANIWKLTLPADRSDFWKTIAEPARREQVARFFAAAIVAENPQKFGLKQDRPISELYPPVAR